MIPYVKNKKNIYTLADVISCVVTEERNGRYELKMTYDASGRNADKIELFGRILAKPNDDDENQWFHIYRITKTIKGQLTVYAEHISYLMSYTPVEAFTFTGTAAEIATKAYQKAWILEHFEFFTDITVEKSYSISYPRSLRSVLLGEEGSILQMFGGGEWKFDNSNVTLMRNRGKNTNVSITYGKNITDITYDDNIATVYNSVYPYWFGEVDGVDTLIVPDNLVYTDNYSSFPYLKGMSLDLTSEFSTPPTKEQLLSAAESYIANNGVGTPDISIDVNFVPLWQVKGLEYLKQLEKVSLCDTVSVIVPHLNIATNAKVVETQYNVLKERYDSIKIGTVKKNFVGKISGDLNNIRSVVDQLKRMR